MKHPSLTGAAVALMVMTAIAAPTFAADSFIPLPGAVPAPGDNPVVETGKYKKDCPYTIGMSHFGVTANTWTIQVAHEAQAAADRESCITKFILLDANFDQKKQVADIEDLIAQKVDAIIVQPVTSTSADAAMV